jgi:hypothetical protein
MPALSYYRNVHNTALVIPAQGVSRKSCKGLSWLVSDAKAIGRQLGGGLSPDAGQSGKSSERIDALHNWLSGHSSDGGTE